MANEEHLAILRQGVEVWNKWREKNLEIPILNEADLNDAHLIYADLRRANLYAANLRGANLYAANLYGADLSRADLRGANLSCTGLSYANLLQTNLSDADLGDALLLSVNLTETILQNAIFSNVRSWGNTFASTDLSIAKGLESVQHNGPSYISIDTLYKSKGQIPESFLRGCGAPDTFITFARSLVNAAIDFYSCFISYSSKNQDFAERLYADLQSKGVRCWFAPEDINIGDKFRQRIDEAIRVHDKLLVILSEDSISSAWVEEEVESAIEREHKEKHLILFPVRIDDAVINSDQAWAASLRRMRHIGDFSKWKDHDSYSKALERLLRDLKLESKT